MRGVPALLEAQCGRAHALTECNWQLANYSGWEGGLQSHTKTLANLILIKAGSQVNQKSANRV